MTQYLIRRVLVSLPVLLLISILLYTILALAPGDPLSELASNPGFTEEMRQNVRKTFGLDDPIPVRYVKWLTAFIQGNLGYSFTSRSPVGDLLLDRLPTTLYLAGVAYLISCFLAILFGMLAAMKPYSLLDQIATALAFVGFSLPTFFVGFVFILLFSIRLEWLPFIYNSTVQVTDLESLGLQIRQSIMPIAVLALVQTATLMRYVRSAAIDTMYRDYVRTAHAKGLPKPQVIGRHVLRNSLIPVITLIALGVPSVFTGAIITEQIFRVPGIGTLLINGIQARDTPVVMAITFIYAILIVAANVLADIFYGIADPRVRLSNR